MLKEVCLQLSLCLKSCCLGTFLFPLLIRLLSCLQLLGIRRRHGVKFVNTFLYVNTVLPLYVGCHLFRVMKFYWFLFSLEHCFVRLETTLESGLYCTFWCRTNPPHLILIDIVIYHTFICSRILCNVSH